jgi:hypothetical protein
LVGPDECSEKAGMDLRVDDGDADTFGGAVEEFVTGTLYQSVETKAA